MAVTQKEVASRLKLSQPAVAFALSNRPEALKQLRPETRARIIQTAWRMGYVPHRAAQRLARGRSGSRATHLDQAGFIYLAGAEGEVDRICLAMMHGVEAELARLAASLVFTRVGRPEDWSKVEQMTKAGSVDGWLLTGPVTDEVINRVESAPLNLVPHVILGDHRCTRPVHCVNVDHAAVGRLAVEHLVSLGHRQIAILKGGTDFVYQREILAGFRSAREKFGLQDDPQLAADAAKWQDPRNGGLIATESVIAWLKSAGRLPTALFVPEPGFPAGLYDTFKQCGVEAPREISILACESDSATTTQNLTRIQLPFTEVGRQGALVLQQIAAEPSRTPREIRILPRLIEGGSTSPPNEGG